MMAARRLRTISLLFTAVVAAWAALPTAPASAQGLFDFFNFNARRPPASASAYNDPYPQFNPFGRQVEPERRAAPSGGSVAYCVRLCDGRFFPIQRSSGADPTQACNSFCPATKTKVFSGSGIDHSVARDGSRYGDLENAFVYRERIVSDCTCNGKDPVGLVTSTAADDPTLRQGDLVATETGFVAYTGGRRRNAEFTPLDAYTGFSSELRARLAGARITPRDATAVPAESLRAYDDDRRVQLDR
jgi:hypothetical protein